MNSTRIGLDLAKHVFRRMALTGKEGRRHAQYVARDLCISQSSPVSTCYSELMKGRK